MRALALELDPESELSRSEAEARALFDDSAEGKLRRRYAADAERELHRNLKAARTLEKSATSTLPEPEKAEAGAAESTPVTPPNEPNVRVEPGVRREASDAVLDLNASTPLAHANIPAPQMCLPMRN